MSSYDGSVFASSSDIDSIVAQKNAIQAVPSPCSRCPPVGSGRERSTTPTLSRPRNPPENRLRPSPCLRFTHQVKLSSSFLNMRARHTSSPFPTPTTPIGYTLHLGTACARG